MLCDHFNAELLRLYCPPVFQDLFDDLFPVPTVHNPCASPAEDMAVDQEPVIECCNSDKDPVVPPAVAHSDTLAPGSPSPIYLKSTPDYHTTLKELHTHFPNAYSASNRGQFFKINTNNILTHTNILDFLKTNKREFYIASKPSGIPFKAVIKGLPLETQCPDII